MGRSACRELLARIEDGDYNEGSSLEMPMELVVRESTGPAKGMRTAKKSSSKS
jgi:DNA-binding LacI/PurR family transcriptional regulator